jgi:hypothetical protein
MIRANCRASFQAADMDFLLANVHRDPKSTPAMEGAELDELLDREEVYRALLDQTGCLRVSPQFYFYVLVRHVLADSGLHDRELADYVAAMLAEFAKAGRLSRAQPDDAQELNYVFEMLQALESASGPRVFFIRAHVGNYSLFMSGIFPEHLLHRALRRGAPGISYFESVGGSNYLTAAEHSLARELRLENVLGCLGDRFPSVRQALNQLSDRLVSLENIPPIP